MTFQDKLFELRDSGFLTEMYKRGLISHKPIYYLDIYRDKMDNKLTYDCLAARLGVSRATVLRAVKSLK